MDSSDKSDGTKHVFKSIAQDKALFQLAYLSNRDSDKNQQADLANHTFPVKAVTVRGSQRAGNLVYVTE